MQQILSAEQQHTLDTISTNQECSIVKYIDSKIALDTMFCCILEDLSQGKSVQVICNEQGLRNEILTKLIDLSLSDYAIQGDHSFQIPDRKIAKLRFNYKSKVLPKGSQKEAYKLAFLQKDIADRYRNLNSKVSGDITIADLPLVMTRKDGGSKKTILSIGEIWSEDSNVNYHQLLGIIHDLSFKYKPLYEELKTSELLSKKVKLSLVNTEAVSSLSDKVILLQNVNQSLLSQYLDISLNYKTKHLESEQAKSQADQTFLREMLLNISDTKMNSSEESGFALFKKKKSNQASIIVKKIAEVNEYLQATHMWDEYIETEIKTQVQLETYILSLLDNVANVYQTSNSDAKVEVTKHLSLLNQVNKDWHQAHERLETHVKNLNEANLLEQDIEVNSKGLDQQITLLKNIDDKLGQLSYRLKNHDDYYINQAEILDSQLKSNIVDCLKHIPTTDWRNVFDGSHYYQLVVSSQTKTLPKDDDILNKLIQQFKVARAELLESIGRSISINQKSTIEKISKNNKQLFQSLIKKKLPLQSTAQELTTHYFEESKSLFPLHLNTSLKQGFDRIYTLDSTSTTNSQINVIFASFTEEDFTDLSNEKSYTPLYLNHYQYTKSIAQLSNTDKIKAAKKLAKLVLSSNQNIKIYQLRHANVISLLPYQDDQILEAKLTEHGAKNMDLDDVYNRLVESLLATDRNQHMVIKDGLLRSDQIDTLAFQQDTIQKLVSAGIRTSSIYTTNQLATDIYQPIDQLCNEILGIEKETLEVAAQQPVIKEEKILDIVETA